MYIVMYIVYMYIVMYILNSREIVNLCFCLTLGSCNKRRRVYPSVSLYSFGLLHGSRK